MLTTRSTITVFDLPGDATAAENAILTGLAKARHTLDVLMYSCTHTPLIDAVIAAKARGVAVRVFLEVTQATDPFNRAATARLVAGIGAANVMINTTPNHEYMHEKSAAIDGKVWASGSTNWTFSGFREENVLLIAHSSALCADLTLAMDALWAWGLAHPYVPKPAPSSGEPPGA